MPRPTTKTSIARSPRVATSPASSSDIVDPDDDPAKEAAEQLATLRAAADATGIKVNKSWGIKRLTAELAK